MTVFLSIDWDFFPALIEEGRTPLPDGGFAPNAMLYDWGLGETGAVGRLEPYLWYSRAGHFRALGLDLTEEFTIREDRGSVRPEDFVAELIRLAGGSLVAPVSWADSHLWGYLALKQAVEEADEPLTVLHFDAHHDLGYKLSQVERMRNQGKVDCGSWLLAALEQGLAEEVHVVYPDWRGLQEWEGSQEQPWWPTASQAQAWTWSSYLERFAGKTMQVDGIFVARSGGWSPPYLDEQLLDMISVLGHEGIVTTMGPPVSMPREWDDATVQEEADMRMAMAAQSGGGPGAAKLGAINEGGGS